MVKDAFLHKGGQRRTLQTSHAQTAQYFLIY